MHSESWQTMTKLELGYQVVLSHRPAVATQSILFMTIDMTNEDYLTMDLADPPPE